jgi:fumarate reductase flavoprotein subunit
LLVSCRSHWIFAMCMLWSIFFCGCGTSPRTQVTLAPTSVVVTPTLTMTEEKTIEQVTRSWPNSPYLDHAHMSKGLECQACHSVWLPQEIPSMNVCLSCHGNSYPALASKTNKLEPNPHMSHNGEIECISCHHAHKPFEYYCKICHTEIKTERFK